MSSPLYSQTVAYTIRAFVNLAREPVGTYKMNKQIAAEEGIPAPYLSKLLQHFARLELLKSTKGPSGGFALQFSAKQISLIDIVAPLDGLAQYKRCAAGLTECTDEMPCSMHDHWKVLRAHILAYLEKTTIADLATALSQKQNLTAKSARKRRTKPSS